MPVHETIPSPATGQAASDLMATLESGLSASPPPAPRDLSEEGERDSWGKVGRLMFGERLIRLRRYKDGALLSDETVRYRQEVSISPAGPADYAVLQMQDYSDGRPFYVPLRRHKADEAILIRAATAADTPDEAHGTPPVVDDVSQGDEMMATMAAASILPPQEGADWGAEGVVFWALPAKRQADFQIMTTRLRDSAAALGPWPETGPMRHRYYRDGALFAEVVTTADDPNALNGNESADYQVVEAPGLQGGQPVYIPLKHAVAGVAQECRFATPADMPDEAA